MAIWFRVKDSGEALSFTADWSTELGTDTLASATWSVPAGVTKDQETIDAPTKTATVKLSGGTNGQVYQCVCAATGGSGQIYNRTLHLKIEDK